MAYDAPRTNQDILDLLNYYKTNKPLQTLDEDSSYHSRKWQGLSDNGNLGSIFTPQEGENFGMGLARAIYSGQVDPNTAALLLTAPDPLVQRNNMDIQSLAQFLAPLDFSREAGKGKLSEEELDLQIAEDLQRYGVIDPAQIGAYKTDSGDTVFFNKNTGGIIPQQFGSSVSGEDQRRFRLNADENGNVAIQVRPKTSSNWQEARGVALVMSVMGGAAAADAAMYGSVGGGQAAAAGGAAEGGLGGAAFNSSIGPNIMDPSTLAGQGLAGGETTLGSGTYGLDSVYNGTMGISNGAMESAGLVPISAAGAGPLELSTGMNGTGDLALPITQGAATALPETLSQLPSTNDGGSVPRPTGTGGNNSGGGIMNGDILGLLASLYGANNTGWIDDLRDIAGQTLERADPFGSERPYYQDRLRETYEDPQAVFDRDYGALDQVFFNELKSQDAARGRSTDAYKRGVEREAKFQDWMLGNRNQLGGFAGAGIDPSAAAGSYLGAMTNLGMMQRQQEMAPWQAVGDFLGGNDGLSIDDIGNAASTIYDWGSKLGDIFGG